MSKTSTARNRADLQPFLSPSALAPRQKPLNVLWMGEMTSSPLSSVAPRFESRISADVGKPSRLTIFRLFNYIQTSFPRHMPWSMFPVVSEPWFEFKPVQSRWGRERDDIYPDPGETVVEVSEIMERYDAFVLDMVHGHYGGIGDVGFNENLLKLAYAVHHLGDDRKPVFLSSGAFPNRGKAARERGYKAVTATEVMDWVRPFGILMYSYRLNFSAIAMKALRAARFGAETPYIIDHYKQMSSRGDRHDGFGRPKPNSPVTSVPRVNHRSGSDHYWRIFGEVERAWDRYEAGLVPQGLDHPLALQLLYALRRAGTISAERFLNSWDGSEHMFGALFGHRNSSIADMWQGTGKYGPFHYGQSKKAEQALLATGLVALDHTDLTLSITEIGERFLNYLHPSCEDPDVISRWLDPETGYFRPDSIAGVEEWLTKFFRKMKTKVNAIPPNLCEQKTRGFAFEMDESFE
jgi:hypothetical protein